jgi:transposase
MEIRKTMAKQLIPQSKVAARYNVHVETIKVWVRRKPKLGFPQPIVINGRYYFDVAQLDAFDARQRREPDGGVDLALLYEIKRETA